MHNGVSLLGGANNVVVKDSSFMVNVDGPKGSRLDRLLDEVAPNAILNAGGRADEVRCYPGTREEVIGKIEKWMDGKSLRQSRMMWLSGPAGAGKSAICHTVAERCQERGIDAANFFFFRGDGTRNHAQPLVATLAYQLLDCYHALKQILEDCLAAKPLICKASTAEQFIRLIRTPIQTFQHSLSGPITLIIDGLDECDGERKQEQILNALHALVEVNNSPFRVLVASRAEPHLVMSFNKFATSVVSIFLDNKYRPQDDIRRFVIAKFDEIKRVHSLARTLDEHWPENTDIDAITEKSSGQFIYAATVMRFIQYSSGSPILSLLTVHGIGPVADHSPLAQVDAVYSYIFSKTRDIQTIKLVLGAHFIFERLSGSWACDIIFQKLLQYAGYGEVEAESFLADLAPIVRFNPGPPAKLFFYHASLSDYLRDESRSGIYCVDMGVISAEWASICLKRDHHNDLYGLEFSNLMLGLSEATTPELSKSLLKASALRFDNMTLRTYLFRNWTQLMINIYRLVGAT